MSRALEAVVVLCVLAVGVLTKDEKPAAETSEGPKTFRRLIPADVLRDFPGVCFASTKCATIDPGQTWDLAPFCGRSTCVKSDQPSEDGLFHLYELVEDCGPLPKSNPKCKLSEKTNKTAPFPECCPIFECEPGVKLEYPELPVVPTETQNSTAKSA